MKSSWQGCTLGAQSSILRAECFPVRGLSSWQWVLRWMVLKYKCFTVRNSPLLVAVACKLLCFFSPCFLNFINKVFFVPDRISCLSPQTASFKSQYILLSQPAFCILPWAPHTCLLKLKNEFSSF